MTEKFETETSAGGIVYKKNKNSFQWLIIQHAGAKHWSFPKGHVGDKVPDEKLEAAALREVMEEGGIKAKILSSDPISTSYVYKTNKTQKKKTVHYFVMEYLSGNPEDHDNEIEVAKFISTEDLMEQLTYDTDKKAFEKALLILGN